MEYKEKIIVDCTFCGYCMPCPKGVDIPKNFNMLNNAHIFNDPTGPRMQYFTLLREDQRASMCDECGECNNICPQLIPIKEKLKDVTNLFDKE
nr:4Fe-4S dicluster domain-containing protein [Methanobacterium alcaliphilum]